MIVCFLTKTPHISTIEFAERLSVETHYRVFIIIDDNGFDTTPFKEKKVALVQVNNKECESYGFKSSTSYAIHRSIARDKAHFYFSTVCRDFSHIWIIEDDVFIPGKQTLLALDQACKDTDLVIPHHYIKNDRVPNTWFWKLVFTINKATFPAPFGFSMMCAVRLSKKMIDSIADYAYINKTTFFAESMYNTLAIHQHFSVATPKEMNTIVYRHCWTNVPLQWNHLYHPVKEFSTHEVLRKSIVFPTINT